MCGLFQVIEELRKIGALSVGLTIKGSLQIGGYPVDHSSQFYIRITDSNPKNWEKLGNSEISSTILVLESLNFYP